MQRLRSFLINLLNLSSESSWVAIIVVFLGFLIVALIGSTIHQGLNTKDDILINVVAIIILAITAFILFRINDVDDILVVRLDEKQEVVPKDILITSLSPYKQFGNTTSSNLDVVINLIKENKAQEVYIVSALKRDESGTVFALHHEYNKDREGLQTAWKQLKSKTENIDYKLQTIENEDSAQYAYEAVVKILAKLESMNRLTDVSIDATAGRKAMSIGLSMAAIQYGVPLTYLSTPRLKNGEPDFNAESAIITTLNANYFRKTLQSQINTTDD